MTASMDDNNTEAVPVPVATENDGGGLRGCPASKGHPECLLNRILAREGAARRSSSCLKLVGTYQKEYDEDARGVEETAPLGAALGAAPIVGKEDDERSGSSLEGDDQPDLPPGTHSQSWIAATQRSLLLMRHALQCRTRDRAANPCRVENCAEVTEQLSHVSNCRGRDCPKPGCKETSRLMVHHLRCWNARPEQRCAVCGPVPRPRPGGARARAGRPEETANPS